MMMTTADVVKTLQGENLPMSDDIIYHLVAQRKISPHRTVTGYYLFTPEQVDALRGHARRDRSKGGRPPKFFRMAAAK